MIIHNMWNPQPKDLGFLLLQGGINQQTGFLSKYVHVYLYLSIYRNMCLSLHFKKNVLDMDLVFL